MTPNPGQLSSLHLLRHTDLAGNDRLKVWHALRQRRPSASNGWPTAQLSVRSRPINATRLLSTIHHHVMEALSGLFNAHNSGDVPPV
jgi:hypothetical protein